MVLFETVIKQALNSLNSKTLAHMSTDEIDEMFGMFLFRAISDFRFPVIALNYSTDTDPYYGNERHFFVNDITQREINVLIALMKVYWLEQQLDKEQNFEVAYYDKDVRTFSRGNMMKSLKSRHDAAIEQADAAQYNYSRIDKDGNIAVGKINE